MKSIAVLAFVFLAILPATCCAQVDRNIRNGGGIVWYAGSVISDTDKLLRIDLGDAHGIVEGDKLAIVRRVDRHFTPIGTVEVEESHMTWCVARPSVFVTLKPGDRVLCVRTLRQMGTPESFRERFLERQLARNRNRNASSTLLDDRATEVLNDIERKQIRWARELKPEAGRIRSASVSVSEYEEMKPLLNQIRKFQEYKAIGVPTEKCIGKEWDSVLTTLIPAPDESAQQPAPASSTAANPDASAEPTATEEEVNTRAETVRRIVDQVMFARTVEERNLAVMICMAIEIEGPRNELQWMSLELDRSQFPQLAQDDAMLSELTECLLKIREKK